MEFVIDDPKKRAIVFNALAEIPCDGSHVVEIRPHKAKRSNAQRRLQWDWYDFIAKSQKIKVQFGGNKYVLTRQDSVHEFFRHMFLGFETLEKPLLVATPEGFVKQDKILRSTADLNTKEFTEYLNNIEAHMATEFNVVLPHPQEYRLAMGLR